MLLGDRSSGLLVWVDDHGEIGALTGGDDAGVVAPHRTGTDEGNTERYRHAGDLALDVRTRELYRRRGAGPGSTVCAGREAG
ncbi:hypothetical protein GCM10023066_54320 [Nocardioides kongjuensis]